MGAMFYLIHDIIVKTNMFLIAGLIRQLRGSMNMKILGGIYANYPKISLVVALVLFSLVGIPPLSGFWPKICLIEGSFEVGNYLLTAALIAGSFVTMFVIARLWSEVFWKDAAENDIVKDTFQHLPRYKKALLVSPIVLLCACSLYIGFGAQSVIEVVDRITDEMINTAPYIRAVLG